MFLKRSTSATTPHAQRGIGIPAALFVITLLAIIAVAINALLAQNANTYEEEINLTRAFYAAESGAGFAMNSIFPPEEFPQYSGTAECAAGPREYTFTIPGLNECTATVSCSVDATVANVEYYTIVSEGSCDGVTRTVQVRSSGQ
jgi:MSHA biogenesis protein MshP